MWKMKIEAWTYQTEGEENLLKLKKEDSIWRKEIHGEEIRLKMKKD